MELRVRERDGAARRDGKQNIEKKGRKEVPGRKGQLLLKKVIHIPMQNEWENRIEKSNILKFKNFTKVKI